MIVKYKIKSGEDVEVKPPAGSTHVVFSNWTPFSEEHMPVFLTNDCVITQTGNAIAIHRNGEYVISGQLSDLLIVKL